MAVFLETIAPWMIFWIMACLCLSITAFIINERVDSQDCDKFSWNDNHIKSIQGFNQSVIKVLFVLFLLGGIFFSFLSGLLWWGIVASLLGILYSWKPIRLKGRFFLDIGAQVGAALVIPALGPLSKTGQLSFWPVILILAVIIWFCIFPYQLADFVADKKAGIKPTHIVLGMKNSLRMGLIFLTLATMAFIYFNLVKIVPWFLVMAPFVAYVFYSYMKWLRMKSLPEQTKSLQDYVRLTKGPSYLIVPYLLVILYLTV